VELKLGKAVTAPWLKITPEMVTASRKFPVGQNVAKVIGAF